MTDTPHSRSEQGIAAECIGPDAAHGKLLGAWFKQSRQQGLWPPFTWLVKRAVDSCPVAYAHISGAYTKYYLVCLPNWT